MTLTAEILAWGNADKAEAENNLPASRISAQALLGQPRARVLQLRVSRRDLRSRRQHGSGCTIAGDVSVQDDAPREREVPVIQLQVRQVRVRAPAGRCELADSLGSDSRTCVYVERCADGFGVT